MGDDKVAYRFHKEKLREASPFWRNALKESWDKGQSEIYLPEADVDAFDVVAAWVYCQRLPTSARFPMNGPKKHADHFELLSHTLDKVYKLSDMLLMWELQNAIADEQVDVFRLHRFNPSFTGLIAFNDLDLALTPYHNLMMTSFVENLANRDPESSSLGTDLQILFARPDLAETAVRMLVASRATLLSPLLNVSKCTFHIHPDGKLCDQDTWLNQD